MPSVSQLRLSITILTVLTALVHLQLAFMMGFDLVFIANGLGYLALMAALLYVKLPFLAGQERLLHYVYIGFTAVTIVAYFAVNGAGSFANPIGLADKALEACLIVALLGHLKAAHPA
jgi:hypothetical protein